MIVYKTITTHKKSHAHPTYHVHILRIPCRNHINTLLIIMLLMCLSEREKESKEFPKGGTVNTYAIVEQMEKKYCIYKPKQKNNKLCYWCVKQKKKQKWTVMIIMFYTIQIKYTTITQIRKTLAYTHTYTNSQRRHCIRKQTNKNSVKINSNDV